MYLVKIKAWFDIMNKALTRRRVDFISIINDVLRSEHPLLFHSSTRSEHRRTCVRMQQSGQYSGDFKRIAYDYIIAKNWPQTKWYFHLHSLFLEGGIASLLYATSFTMNKIRVRGRVLLHLTRTLP